MMPGGLLLLLCVPGLYLLPRKLSKWYSFSALAAVTLYHWFIPPFGGFTFSYAGFQLRLYQFRWAGFVAGLAFAFFGLCWLLFSRSKNYSRTGYAAGLVHLAAALSLPFCGDFLSLFVYWELLTVSAIVLLLGDRCGRELLTEYFTYQIAGSVLLLIGIGVNYSQTSSLALRPVPAAYLLFLPAIFIKTAVLPFHGWLTSAYTRIKPELTAFLSAYTTKAGAVSLLLLVPGVDLEILGALLALSAVILALGQVKLRGFLSFHLVSQVGYILAGLSASSGATVAGGVFHLVNNVIYKGLLFMVVAILIKLLDDETIAGGGGLSLTRRHPLLFGAALVASASITGLPPFNGYVSKKLIVGGLDSNLASWLLVAAGVGTGLSFAKFLYFCFLKPGGQELSNESKFRLGQKIPVFLLALTCVLTGLFPGIVLTGTAASQTSFYTIPAVVRGLLPGLTGILIFTLGFNVVDPAFKRLSRDCIDPGGIFLPPLNYCLDKLQQAHAGSLQRYLFLFFTFLLITWLFFYLAL